MAVDDHKDENIAAFAEFQSMWQDNEPAVLREFDLKATARKARWIGWRMRVVFAIEFLCCLFGLGACLYVLFQSPKTAMLTFAVFGSVYCILGMWATVVVRRGAWGSSNDTIQALIQLEIDRACSAIKYMKMNVWFSALGVPFIGLAVWVLTSDPSVDPHRRDVSFGIYAVMGMVFIGIWLYAPHYIRKKRQELRELHSVQQYLKSG